MMRKIDLEYGHLISTLEAELFSEELVEPMEAEEAEDH
jgi:hypothetical protein